MYLWSRDDISALSEHNFDQELYFLLNTYSTLVQRDCGLSPVVNVTLYLPLIWRCCKSSDEN